MDIATKPAATFTSREFNQDTARAKRAAEKGPVFITDRGEPAYVLMSIDEFRRLEQKEPEQKKPTSLREALVDRVHGDDIELIIPERRIEPIPEIDFD